MKRGKAVSQPLPKSQLFLRFLVEGEYPRVGQETRVPRDVPLKAPKVFELGRVCLDVPRIWSACG